MVCVEPYTESRGAATLADPANPSRKGRPWPSESSSSLRALAFYAFIGTAQDEVIKLGLALFWAALIILSIVAEFLH